MVKDANATLASAAVLETVVVSVVGVYSRRRPGGIHVADVAHRATASLFGPDSHRVCRRAPLNVPHVSASNRRAAATGAAPPQEKYSSRSPTITRVSRRSTHPQRDTLSSRTAGTDGPGANHGRAFVHQDGGGAADPDAQDTTARGGLRAARNHAGNAGVVLVRGNARQLMLLAEAAQAADVAGSGPTMGRPTCAVLPEAINSARTAASFGCIGNRVYTGADDGEAYFAIPGAKLGAVEEHLAVIVRANQELEKFHQGRATATPTA